MIDSKHKAQTGNVKKMLGSKQTLRKKVVGFAKDVDERFKVIRVQLNQIEDRLKFGEKQYKQLLFQIGNDLSLLQERSMVQWEILWALIENLKSTGIDEDTIEKHRLVVTARWKATRLIELKKDLTKGQILCEGCLLVDVEEKFLENDLICPRCKEPDLFFHEGEDES